MTVWRQLSGIVESIGQANAAVLALVGLGGLAYGFLIKGRRN